MIPRRMIARTVLGIAVPVVLAGLLPPTASAHAGPRSNASTVTQWAQHRAVRIPAQLDRRGPDLATIRWATRDAQIVGLGETSHLLHEVSSLKSRYLRYLVEHEGFRAVAWEDDWTLGTRINDYLLGRRNDIETVLGTLDPSWRTREVLDTLTWLRHFNDTHIDDVRFAGVEYFATGPLAYATIENYVADHAPDRLSELCAYFDLLRPESEEIGAHLTDYLAVTDKTPYLEAAADVLDLVAALDPARDDDEYELVAHHARQIWSFYHGFSRPFEEIPAYRDARAAENVRWWQQYTGARVVYWAAGAHVADVPELTITQPGQPDSVFASAGSYLADWYGPAYVPIGFSYDHGTYQTDGAIVDLPEPAPGWFEQPLGDVRSAQFLLVLGGPAPHAVRDWLDRPLQTRGLPEFGYESTMSGGTLREWYDVIVHRQDVTPARPL